MNSAIIFDLFASELSRRDVEYSTRRQYELWIRRYQEFLLTNQIELLNSTSETIVDYIGHCKHGGYSNSTVNNNLRIVDALYRFVVGQCWLISNPAVGVKRLARRKSIFSYVETESLKYLVYRYQKDGQSVRNQIIFDLMKEVCLRAKEIVELKVSDLLQSENLLMARSGSGQKRKIPLNNEMMAALKHYVGSKAIKSEYIFTTNAGSRISRVTVYALVRRAMLKNKLPSNVIRGVSSLRLSKGTQLINDGKTTQEIAMSLNSKYTSLIIDRFIPSSQLKCCHTQFHPKGSR